MASVTFDTLKFVERLERSGVSREQATAMAEAQKDSFSEVLDTTLATKEDIQALRLDLKVEMAGFKGEMTSIKWMIGVLVGLAIANFVKQFF